VKTVEERGACMWWGVVGVVVALIFKSNKLIQLLQERLCDSFQFLIEFFSLTLRRYVILCVRQIFFAVVKFFVVVVTRYYDYALNLKSRWVILQFNIRYNSKLKKKNFFSSEQSGYFIGRIILK
jgi:hypothetical protein